MPDALSTDPFTLPGVTSWRDQGGRISLHRAPGTDQAHQAVDAVAAMTAPLLQRDRPLGAAGRRTHHAHTGIIMAGLLKAGLRGHPVRAPRGKGRPWRSSAIGQERFWGQAEALERAGLVRITAGIAYAKAGRLTGKPAVIECAPALLDIAAAHGLTDTTFTADFPLTAAAQLERPVIGADERVVCLKVPVHGDDERTRCPFPPAQAEAVAAMLAHLDRLNAHLARAHIAGCVPPVLRRSFFADVRLNGRFHAIGGEAFQGVRRRDRHTLRIDRAPVVEVDLCAAALSIFLALHRLPIPADPYAAGALATCDRDVVKAWVVQLLNSGRTPPRWSDRHPSAIRAVPIKGVAAAALATYPALAAPTDILPADLAAMLPIGREGWALGQWLVGIEAGIMEATLERLMGLGVIALPLHDALLCREEDAEEARRSLVDAFQRRLGATPQTRIKNVSKES